MKRNNEIEEIRVTGRNVKFINPNAFLKECSRFVYDYYNDIPTDGLTIYDFLIFHVCFVLKYIKQIRKGNYLLAYLPLPRIPINSTSNTKVAPAGIRSPAPRLP